MTRVRCITEIGMGVDVRGRDATKAAKRAVSDAIRHSSLIPHDRRLRKAQASRITETLG
jgi:uncharacterized protein (TIGR02058 family)